jgi:hypothetical protein
MRSDSHLGTGFTVWNREQTWFWKVVNQPLSSGAVGAAATEAEAVREACSSIEEMAMRPELPRASMKLVAKNNSSPDLDRFNPFFLAVLLWLVWTLALARYLTDKMIGQSAYVPIRSSQCFLY